MSERSEYLISAVKKSGIADIDISSTAADKLVDLYDLIIYTNKYINLTRITSFEDYILKHVIDSLALVHFLHVENVDNCVDIGCGAGFPGLPLAIVYPHLNVTLVDSVGKKVNFVNETIEKLGLKNAAGLHARAEDLGRDRKYRESFDLCTSRAVARFSTLSELCLPLVKVHGTFVSYKSGNSDEEIDEGMKAVSVLGGKITAREKFGINDLERVLVLTEKMKKTPDIYPRKAGTPSRKPIM